MDDTRRDEPMLAWMAPFLQRAGTKQVYLFHVHDSETDPHTTKVVCSSDTLWDVPVTPSADITERTRDRMHGLAERYLSPVVGLGWQTVLSSEAEVPAILSRAAAWDVDLIVIGRHYGDSQFKSTQAVTARRIAEKSTCSVLVLPESAVSNISSVIVPVRYSECSAIALKTAVNVATAFTTRTAALNVYRVSLSGGDRLNSERLQELKFRAEEENRLLLQSIENTECVVISQCVAFEGNDPVSVILSAMERANCDLVVIGARGRTGAAGILLGAVTEALIQRSPVPVLAVKKKGECIDLLHALLSLLKKHP